MHHTHLIINTALYHFFFCQFTNEIDGFSKQADIHLKCKQKQESHHEAEKTHSLGQSKTQNGE